MRESDYLKNLRLKKEITQEELAGYIGIKRTTYAAYEQGRSRAPIEILVKLAFFYGINLEKMYYEMGKYTLDAKEQEMEEKLLDYYQQSNQKNKEMVKEYIAYVSKKK